jgi:hypothetical protein
VVKTTVALAKRAKTIRQHCLADPDVQQALALMKAGNTCREDVQLSWPGQAKTSRQIRKLCEKMERNGLIARLPQKLWGSVNYALTQAGQEGKAGPCPGCPHVLQKEAGCASTCSLVAEMRTAMQAALRKASDANARADAAQARVQELEQGGTPGPRQVDAAQEYEQLQAQALAEQDAARQQAAARMLQLKQKLGGGPQ